MYIIYCIFFNNIFKFNKVIIIIYYFIFCLYIFNTKIGLGLMSLRLELGFDIVYLADLSFFAFLRKCRLGI